MSEPRPSPATSAEALLDEFLDSLWLEDGLSRNTLESYRRDLRQFAKWLRPVRGRGLAGSRARGLACLPGAALSRAGKDEFDRAAALQPEAFLSLLRYGKGKLASDPTLNIDAPKLARRLPKSLTEADVESLLLRAAG